MPPLKIAIGYDPREAIVYHVCANSIIRHSSVPVEIIPLALNNLLHEYNESHVVESGKVGYKPTNQFTFSRFLAPSLVGYTGKVLFMDGDMIVRDDIKKLFDLHVQGKAVSVVKHDYKTKFPIKYLGQKNGDYPRKNWSSVMLFDNSHFACKRLIPEVVHHSTGEYLHRFGWCKDSEIGELPVEWNWLVDEYGENPDAKLLHWTAGSPCFHEYATTPMAAEWHRERILTTHNRQIGL